jgi:hypothetical protein
VRRTAGNRVNVQGVELSNTDDAPPIPLSRRPFGIETFHVEGTLDSGPVHARWDGRWVMLSTALYERVELALAVEDVFADAGMAEPLQSTPWRPSPEEVMLSVLTCCDDIDRAEFDIRGYHRVIAPGV